MSMPYPTPFIFDLCLNDHVFIKKIKIKIKKHKFIQKNIKINVTNITSKP